MSRKNLLVVVLGVATVFGLLALLFLFVNQQTNKPEVRKDVARSNRLVVSQNAPVIDEKSQPSLTEDDGCSLKRTVNNVVEEVFTSKTCSVLFERWGNFLFFQEGDGYADENITLVAYNLLTGEKIILYSLEDHLDDMEGRTPYEISFMDIIDNELYFSLGGYMTAGAAYVVALPFDARTEPKQLQNMAGSIVYEYGRYWSIDAFGDGGVYGETRALFDIKNHTRGGDIDTGEEMGIGTKFVGSNGQEVFIEQYESEHVNGPGEDGYVQRVSEVYALDLETLKKKTVIFRDDAFSSSIRDVDYLYNEEIFLVALADNLMTYNPETKKIEDVMPIAHNSYDLHLVEEKVCLDGEVLDLQKKTSTQNSSLCSRETMRGEEEIKEKISGMNLPKEYSLEVPEGE